MVDIFQIFATLQITEIPYIFLMDYIFSGQKSWRFSGYFSVVKFKMKYIYFGLG